jgi:hypothetical protein
MKDSIKANLIVFFIIAIVAFGVSSAFASLTIHEDNDSYKLVSIEDDSFEPSYIYKVPTVKPKIENTTNITDNTTDDSDDEDWNDTYIDLTDNYTDWNETLIEDYVEY